MLSFLYQNQIYYISYTYFHNSITLKNIVFFFSSSSFSLINSSQASLTNLACPSCLTSSLKGVQAPTSLNLLCVTGCTFIINLLEFTFTTIKTHRYVT